MPTVTSTNNFGPGDIATAAELNAPYDDLQTASSNLDSDNTASGWITWRHMASGPTGIAVANALYEYENPTTTQTSYNSTSYTTITQGGNPAQITLNVTPDVGEVVRFMASGMVGESTIATDYDYAGLPAGNKGKNNYYAFRLLLNHTTGGVPGTTVIGEWGYSFTTKKSGTLTNTISQPLAGAINWQPFAFSACYRQSTAGRVLNSIVLQCKVFINTNTLKIERHELYAIRGKR